MIYVMSDIHGQYPAYVKMLETIGFSEQDTLYILGDVLDRGKQGITLLMDIMHRDNVVLLRGNHEQILIDRYSDTPVVPINYLYWFHELGGKHTESAYLKLEPEQKKAVLEYLDATPLQLQVKAGGRQYYLVHGYPDMKGDIDTILWERLEPGARLPQLPPKIDYVVFGHTPTDYYTGSEAERPIRIYFDSGVAIIGIDCGCAYQNKTGQLGCLCLDNLEEYYTPIL